MLYTLFKFSHSPYPYALSIGIFIYSAFFLLFSLFAFIRRGENAIKEFAVSIFFDHKIARTIYDLLVFLSIFVFLFGNRSIMHLLGEKDVRTMHNGTYCYYVVAESETGKEYTMPAKIEVHNSTSSDSIFYVRNVYFPNGGYLYIDSKANNGAIMSEYGLPSRLPVQDQNGREWRFTVTNKKATHEKVKDSSLIRAGDLIFCTVKISIVLLTWILCLYYIRKERNE